MKHLLLFLSIFFLAGPAFAQPDRVYRSLQDVEDPALVYQLRLNFKHLAKVPDEIRDMKNLRVLDLSKNQIVTLPGWIGELSQLRELYLGRNHLCRIPGEIARLDSLRVLSADRNPLLELPDEIGSMSHLEELILWSTGISVLPPTFVMLNGTLRHLDLRACEMSHSEQEELRSLLPDVDIDWYQSCNCR